MLILQPALALALAPGLVGLIRWLKARLQSRRGPPPWQPYAELRKLFGKEVVVAHTELDQVSGRLRGGAARFRLRYKRAIPKQKAGLVPGLRNFASARVAYSAAVGLPVRKAGSAPTSGCGAPAGSPP